jgi:predicted ABC-class ATPase
MPTLGTVLGENDLRALLRRIDGRGYESYQEIRGAFALPGCELFVDRVQADPFASPSRVRLRVPMQRAALPAELREGRVRRLGLAGFLARQLRSVLAEAGTGRRLGSGHSGLVTIDAGGQQVLERTAIRLADDFVEARLSVGLPAAGRRVLGREAEALLCELLPEAARRALAAGDPCQAEARRFVAGVERQEQARARLDALGLVAFVPDGAILPRESGASDRPLRQGAIPFRAPPSLRVAIELEGGLAGAAAAGPGVEAPDARRVVGLGIPKGVTAIVGGGYHGKSTLLRALERGVHPFVPGDGREGVVSIAEAVKIRAEDGRRVEACDVSAFVGPLPGGRGTRAFSSESASGSTSQAANLMEALEAGARAVLLDEDTSATNFLVRDARMQALVPGEPLIPLLDRVRELHDTLGVSTLLVVGSCGDWLDVADTVIEMREFLPHDVTGEARRVAALHPTSRRRAAGPPLRAPSARVPLARSVDPARGRREVAIEALGAHTLRFGEERIDLSAVEQLVDASQTRAVGQALRLARERFFGGDVPLAALLDALDALLDSEGLDILDPWRRPGGEAHPGDFARPRRLEIAAALCRLRSLRMRVATLDSCA